MTVLTAPEPKVFVLLDEDIFEAVVTSIEVVPNTFYEEGEPDHKRTQLEWKLTGRAGDAEGVIWTMWSSTQLSTHPKAMLIPHIKAVDPKAVIGKTFDTDTLIGKGVRILNKHKKGTKPLDDGTMPVYNKAASLLPSKLSAPTKAMVEAFIAALPVKTVDSSTDEAYGKAF